MSRRTWDARLVPGPEIRLGAKPHAVSASWLDLPLYGLSAGFAAITAITSTLPAHRAWGAVAWMGYALCALAAAGQAVARRVAPATGLAGPAARVWLALVAWLTTALLPLIMQAAQRAGGQAGRAQEEVLVIEDGGRRLLETGTPYLARAEIAALPEPLLGYLPYQPAMAIFGMPRALDPGAGWWSDARVWFAVVTAAAVAAAIVVLRRAGSGLGALVWAVQAVAVLPVATLTLATGGDDLPVLALCLLALALAGTGRWGWSGAVAGLAAALKLIAWPVALVLAMYAVVRGRAVIGRFAAGLLMLPLVTGLPAALIDPAAMAENVIAFPLGDGLVTSPAASPLPGYLLATGIPGGRAVALGLLLAFGAGLGVWLLRHPPRTAAAAAGVCAVGLLGAIMLLPATRFGYLLYPAAFALAMPALRSAKQRPATGAGPRELPSPRAGADDLTLPPTLA